MNRSSETQTAAFPTRAGRLGARTVLAVAIVAGVGLVAPVGCTTVTQAEVDPEEIDRTALEGVWEVRVIAGTAIAELFEGARLRQPVTFEIGRDAVISGNAGVNRFNAALRDDSGALAEWEADAFVLGPIMATKMAGTPAAMEGERRVLDALQRARRFDPLALREDRLILTDEDGANVLVASRPG